MKSLHLPDGPGPYRLHYQMYYSSNKIVMFHNKIHAIEKTYQLKINNKFSKIATYSKALRL